MVTETQDMTQQPQEEEESAILRLARTQTRRQLLDFYTKVTQMLPDDDDRKVVYLDIADALREKWRYQAEARLSTLLVEARLLLYPKPTTLEVPPEVEDALETFDAEESVHDLDEEIESGLYYDELEEEEEEEEEEILPDPLMQHRIELLEQAQEALKVCKREYMQWSTKTVDWKGAMVKLKAGVSTRSVLPILSNVLIEPDGQLGVIWLTVTNLEIGIRTCVEAEIIAIGDDPITLPYTLLEDEGKQIEPGARGKMQRLTLTELEEEGQQQRHRIHIKNGDMETTYKRGIDASEFPLIPIIPESDLPHPYVFQASDLKRIISLVAFAAADDESRPVLTGIHIGLKEQRHEKTREIELAAADAFRLATITYESLFMPFYDIDDDLAPKKILIPARTLTALAPLLPQDQSDVFFYCNPQRSQVQISVPKADITLTSRLIDGTFPNFHQIIPRDENYGVYAEISVGALKQAYGSLKAFAKDSSNISRLIVEKLPKEDKNNVYEQVRYHAYVRATAEDLGDRTKIITQDIHNVSFRLEDREVIRKVKTTVIGVNAYGEEEEVEVEVDGEVELVPQNEMGIIFNLKYMIDFLDKLSQWKIDRVRLYLQASTKPGKLVPIGLESYSYTIMPMHINR